MTTDEFLAKLKHGSLAPGLAGEFLDRRRTTGDTRWSEYGRWMPFLDDRARAILQGPDSGNDLWVITVFLWQQETLLCVLQRSRESLLFL